MSEKQFLRFFQTVTRLTLTLVLIACLYILRSVEAFAASPELAMAGFAAFPYMTENVLTGVALYLAFALTMTKIRLSSLHDGK